MAPVLISGALAGETCLEKAVGVAAMVRTQQLPMQRIAERLKSELGIEVVVAGVEAVMASLGALTTPLCQACAYPYHRKVSCLRNPDGNL